MRKKKKIGVLLLILGLCLVVALIFFSPKEAVVEKNADLILPSITRNNQKPSGASFSTLFASPSPLVAFMELTIPYLRGRDYKSTLGPLQKLADSGTYTSHLTSYESDGLKINGLLTIPSGQKPVAGWPAIVFVHGYVPPQQYQTQTKYVDHVNFLARNGFVVFKIDLRGHGNSEGTPGGGYYSSDYIIDVLSAHSALQSADFVNPNKIGLWGHSMAGNVLLRSLVSKPEIPAVVIWAGAGFTYSDLRQFGITDTSYQPPPSNSDQQRKRRLLREVHGDFDANSPFWQQVAPTLYLPQLKGALQLVHAADDPVVSIKYSQNLDNILDSTNVIHELHEYPNGGHNISGASFTTAMQKSVEFYKKYLGS